MDAPFGRLHRFSFELQVGKDRQNSSRAVSLGNLGRTEVRDKVERANCPISWWESCPRSSPSSSNWVKEPERWLQTQRLATVPGAGLQPARVRQLFAPELRRATLVGSGLAFVAVFGLWGATYGTPLIRGLPELRALSEADLTSRVSYATMLLNVGSLLGYLSFGPLPEKFGRRTAFGIMCAGSLVLLPACSFRRWEDSGVRRARSLQFTSLDC